MVTNNASSNTHTFEWQRTVTVDELREAAQTQRSCLIASKQSTCLLLTACSHLQNGYSMNGCGGQCMF